MGRTENRLRVVREMENRLVTREHMEDRLTSFVSKDFLLESFQVYDRESRLHRRIIRWLRRVLRGSKPRP